MENKVLRCTFCGAKLPASDSEIIACPYCDSVNYLRFAEKVGKDDYAESKLKNLRERLTSCVNAKYHDFEEMKEISDEILSLSGYDFEAKYFYALALKKNNKRNKYAEFLSDKKNLSANADCLSRVLDNVVRYAKENERTLIKQFIDINVADELARLEYMDRADRQIERASKNFKFGQDVFVCHKSYDAAVAETVVSKLESEGVSCFLAERNLEDLEIGERFEAALKKAISSTKIFLLISSYRAFSTDEENYVLFEIASAKELQKPNAEFRIEYIDGETEKRAGEYCGYFDGCQYIEAYPHYGDMLDKLCAHLKNKLAKLSLTGSDLERIRMEERERAEREAAEKIERLQAEKAAVESKLSMAGKSFGSGNNIEAEASEKEERDAVFGYSIARSQIFEAGGGEDYYKKALEYDYGTAAVVKDKAKAVYWYIKAADCGHSLAQLNLGVCYEYGDGIKKNPQKAVELYVKSAESGNAMAQCNLGYCYFNGVGVEKDAGKAVLWYKKAADNGNARALNNLGYCYENGSGCAMDKRKAFSCYESAAEKGDVNGACNAAWCLESGIGTPVDLVRARIYNAVAKEKGSVRAAKAIERIEEKLYACSPEADEEYEKGLIFDIGEKVKRNPVKAAQHYAKAARLGSVRAAYNMGVFCLRGDGVKVDRSAGAEFFKTAAEKAHLGALYNLGYCSEKGLGTQKDLSKAYQCYLKSALGGYAPAQYAVGYFKENAVACACDYAGAMEMYKRAASGGFARAFVAMGLLYGAGSGVEKNLKLSAENYAKAAQLGDEVGLYDYGCVLRDGLGVNADSAKARNCFAEAAAKGYTPALFNLGQMALEEGDEVNALKFFRQGAMSGDEACKRAAEKLN